MQGFFSWITSVTFFVIRFVDICNFNKIKVTVDEFYLQTFWNIANGNWLYENWIEMKKFLFARENTPHYIWKMLKIILFYSFLSFFDSSRTHHPRCSVKKGVLKNFAKFTGKHLCQSLFFNKVAGLRLQKELWHRCFPVNFG